MLARAAHNQFGQRHGSLGGAYREPPSQERAAHSGPDEAKITSYSSRWDSGWSNREDFSGKIVNVGGEASHQNRSNDFSGREFTFWNAPPPARRALTNTFPQAYSVSLSTPESLVILRDSTAFLLRPQKS